LNAKESIPASQNCYSTEWQTILDQVLDQQWDKLNAILGAADLDRIGYRLPTEAEWEYACRAGTQTSRSFGSSEVMLKHYAWYTANAKDPQRNFYRVQPVGLKKPNALGLFDMYGNAGEWCQDPMWVYPVNQEFPFEDTAAPKRAEAGGGRVVRGGAFNGGQELLRSAYRLNNAPQDRTHMVGFRLARTVFPR
jgi:formylglycine-generating enzyme required for sulfatase activity